MKEHIDRPNDVLAKAQPDVFMKSFELAMRGPLTAESPRDVSDHVHFRDIVAAQLCLSWSTSIIGEEIIGTLSTLFDSYETRQMAHDLQVVRQARPRDYMQSNSQDIAFMRPKAKPETKRRPIHTATFHPMTFTCFETNDFEKVKKQFPKHRTNYTVLFLPPLVASSYPLTVHRYGNNGQIRETHTATIITTAVRCISTWQNRYLMDDLWMWTTRTWHDPGTDSYLAHMDALSAQLAHDLQYFQLTHPAQGGKADRNAR